ncbi:hypothetical protein L1049_000644 [Liquidambar formosana]|uniref:gibberellin 2beta-dioxygenase n=1 Tax=Liquidambar formosana TaxID=63359 RepID=A0AAP0ND49_LIQFO
MASDPPYLDTYKTLFQGNTPGGSKAAKAKDNKLFMVEECDLPLIDLSRLNLDRAERDKCKRKITDASSNWGFFQVINHGVPRQLLKSMQYEQMKVFHQPFYKKSEENFLNLPANSYRWGNPAATCLRQFSWSEAFHIPLTDISRMDESTIEVFATTVSVLAQSLAEILAQNLGEVDAGFFQENCSPSTSYLRMNRYPPCPISSEVFGMMPHTDSDFLTILYQDQVGGLQLVKDDRWFSVKPNPDALIINIGDLFQAWSNGVYKSVEHQVVASEEGERFSVAYFYCPSYNTVIQSYSKPAVYRTFSFKEYRQQVKTDVGSTGYKVGLPRKTNIIRKIQLAQRKGQLIYPLKTAQPPQTKQNSTNNPTPN